MRYERFILLALLLVGAAACQQGSVTRTDVSDAATTAKVKTALAADPTVSATSINVDTSAGVVTLTGKVPDEQARQKALELARATSGVTRVTDQLTIDPSVRGARSEDTAMESARVGARAAADLAIEASVKSALGASRKVNAGDVRVHVDKGVVTLEPDSGKKPDLDAAAAIARKVPGVKEVKVPALRPQGGGEP
jgi:osmotically-inducible protein OsmY